MKTAISLCFALFVCNAVGADQSDVDRYLSLDQADKTLDLEQISDFADVFKDLNVELLDQQVSKAYAEELYFNDTFVTLVSRQALVDYLQNAASNANSVQTTILDVARSNDDVYIRWHLVMEFDLAGKTRNSSSVGMTHLRFNQAGQIIVHQDFWDSASGFYRHVPILGKMISWVNNRMHP